MITQLQTVERLLEGLAPATPFRDAIIGDLAEEFRERAESSGAAAARRWYYREACRAAPHLFLAWLRGLRGSDAKQLANALLPSAFFAVMISFFIILTGTSVLSALGYSAKTATHAPMSQIVTALGLVAMAIGATAGGAIAAWLNRRAPFATAVALGFVYAGVHFALSFSGPRILYARPLAIEFVIALGAVMGGVLHTHVARDPYERTSMTP